MHMNYTKILFLILSLLGLMPSLVLAQTASTIPTAKNSVQMTKAQTRADQEIQRRIAALTSLSSRMDATTRLSASLKQGLANNIQNQIQLLTALQAKIDADTDIATLKTDIASLAQEYRIFILIVPQGRISALGDRVATITAMMQGIGNKLQSRMQTASQQGVDISGPTALLVDLGAKIVDAQNQAQTAINTIAGLTPDNGNKVTMAINSTSLSEAHSDLKIAQTDLITGRKDITGIMKFLASLPPVTATTTAQ